MSLLGEQYRVLVEEKIADSGVDLLRERFEVDVGDGLERRRARGADRRLRRDPDPLGDADDGGADRPRGSTEGDRPRRDRRRQRRRRGGDQARDHRRQRAAVEHRRGGGAHDRADARAGAQHPAGARVADRARGSARGSVGSRSTRRRWACSGSAASASSSPPAHAAFGMRVVAFDPFVSAERFRELGAEKAETPRRRSTRRPTSSRSTCRGRRRRAAGWTPRRSRR